MNSDPSALIEHISSLPKGRQELLGVLSGVRFIPLLIDPVLGKSFDGPASLHTLLIELNRDPIQILASPHKAAGVLSILHGWLEKFDDEPEDDEYWPYQAAVVLEYMLRLVHADEPTTLLAGMTRYCIDFAYFLDQELDRGGANSELAEISFFSEVVRYLGSDKINAEGISAQIKRVHIDESRILQTVKDVAQRSL